MSVSARPSRAVRRRARAGALAAIGAAGLAALAGTYLFLQQDDAETLARANALGTEGRYADALAEARRVSRPPAADRAALTEAYALVGTGHLEDAARAFARAARLDPRNWVIHRDWARTQLAMGRPADAGRTMAKARALNPRMSLPPGFHAARGGDR